VCKVPLFFPAIVPRKPTTNGS